LEIQIVPFVYSQFLLHALRLDTNPLNEMLTDQITLCGDLEVVWGKNREYQTAMAVSLKRRSHHACFFVVNILLFLPMIADHEGLC
jgi:hypothetical protein